MSHKQASLDSWLALEKQNIQGHKNNVTTRINPPLIQNTRLVQTSIQSNNNDLIPFDSHWGHSMPPKNENALRLGFRNVNSLPISASNVKNDLLVLDILKNGFDIFGTVETNVAWQNLPLRDKAYERFRTKFEISKIVYSNNVEKDYSDRQQSGGTLTLCQGHVCARIVDWGQDISLMGRWSWIRLRGTNGVKLRFVSVYRPVISYGAMSAYQQQRNLLLEKGIDTCPRKQLLLDLELEIKQWINEGDQLIIAGDFNDDIRKQPIQSIFSQHLMKELILEQHGNNAPNTYGRGNAPIDGIFATRGIDAIFSGYTAGNWGMNTDHRALWVDLDINKVFGGLSIPLWKPRMRRLKLEDPLVVNTFNKLRQKHISRSKIPELKKMIEIKIKNNENINTWAHLFETIDGERLEGMLYAERHCRKLKCGNVPWSPAIRRCMKNIAYLQACRLRYKYHRNINSRTLLKLFQDSTLQNQVTNEVQAVLALKEQYKEFNLLKRKASELRINFLNELAERKSMEGKVSAESALKQLKTREEQRSLAQSVKRVLLKIRSRVTAVEAEDESNRWTLYTKKEDIERECMNANIQRYTQASNLPIMNKECITQIGLYAETNLSDRILQGDTSISNISSIPDEVRQLFSFMKRPEGISLISTNITREQYIKEWKKSKEFTSTGISGIHFGHFKAACIHDDLLEFDRWMIEVSLKNGYTLNRWKKGIDIMIPKKQQSLKVGELRTLVLLEADFNFLNKMMGKRLMQQAEKANSVAPEQFGSRKMKGSINHAINKQLTVDIMRQEKRAFTLVVLDAKGCYDRIALHMAAMSMRRQGAPIECVQIMFKTIREMEHFIRTAYGDSSGSYTQQNKSFHGILQGNGAGPTIWALLSSPLLDKLRHQGFGVFIRHELKDIQIPAFAFVDDVDIIQTIDEDIHHNLTQQAVSDWEKSLQATGGMLVPHKCKYFVCKYNWKDDRWQLQTNLDRNIQIKISDDQGHQQNIQQIPSDKGELALGIMFSPSGSNNDETEHLRSRALDWAEKVRTGHLSRKEAWYCLNATVIRAIDYALPATSLTYKQCESIMSPILNIGLPRSGICRKISRSVVYASIRHQGLGIRHPFISQGIFKIQIVYKLNQTLTQKLFEASWVRLMIESGYGSRVLEYPIKWISPALTKGWLYSMWEFLSHYRILMRRVDDKYEKVPRHSKDEYIMLVAAQKGLKFTPNELIRINSCRLYLQIMRISDILTADGRSIRKDVWTGKNDVAHMEEGWPKQPRPSNKAWNLWRQFLRDTIGTDEHGKCVNRFPSISYTMDWRWFLKEDENRIYEKSGNDWFYYPVFSNCRNNRNRIFYNRQITENPNQVTPVTVYSKGQGIAIDGIGMSTDLMNTEIERYKIWTDFVAHQNFGDMSILQEKVTVGEEELLVMSDASVKDGKAGAAWIISTKSMFENNVYYRGWAKVSGNTLDSHRAEAFGIYGGIYSTLYLIQQVWKMDTIPKLHFGCDNDSVIKFSFGDQVLDSFVSDFDVLMAIRNMLKDNGINPQWHHVKGHQSGRDLDIWAQLNNLADKYAGEARETSSLQAPPETVNVYKERWQVIIENKKCTKNLSTNLYEFCTAEEIKSTWNKYGRIKEDYFSMVDWDAMHSAMKESTIAMRHWITKRAARDCGSNRVLFVRKQRKDDKCPFCTLSESVIHVCTCQSSVQQQTWTNALDDFKKWLVEKGTKPEIITSLISGLQKWNSDSNWDGSDSNDPLVVHQCKVGWNGVIEGVFGVQWKICQQEHFESIRSRRTGRKWLTEVIKRIWKIPWLMWERRNLEVHAADNQVELNNLLEKVEQEIIEQQNITEDCHFFSQREIDKIRSQCNAPYLRAWLRGVKAWRRREELKRGTESELHRMRSVMREFLGQGGSNI